MRKILAHTAAIIGLYLAFSLALFLGLQVDAVYGNNGLVAVAVLVGVPRLLGLRQEVARGRRAPKPPCSATRSGCGFRSASIRSSTVTSRSQRA